MNKLQVKYFNLLEEYSNEVSEANYPYSEKAGQYPETHPFENAPAEILDDEEFKLGRIKYNDKILHQSKILKSQMVIQIIP